MQTLASASVIQCVHEMLPQLMMANTFSDGYDKYTIIADRFLPENVQEELEGNNHSGQLVNPTYNPLFKQWLEREQLPTDQCYIVWFNW